MSLVFQRSIAVDSVATNADSTPTISIVRLDTSATVIATTSTGVTNPATGQYSYMLSSPVAGVTYRATWTMIVSGQTITSTTERTAAGSEWYYADQTDVEDLIGADALRLISNEPNAASDATTNAARVLRFGLWTDQYIDTKMRALGYVTPMTGMSAGTELIMADISAHLVAYYLNEPRLLTSVSSSRNANAIDKIVQEHSDSAEATLRKIAFRSILITADRLYARPPFGKVSLRTYSDSTWAGRTLVSPYWP